MSADAYEMMKKKRTKAAPNKTLNNNQPAKRKRTNLMLDIVHHASHENVGLAILTRLIVGGIMCATRKRYGLSLKSS